MSSRPILKTLVQNNDKKALTVSWTDGETQVYPYIWLRNNCQCRTACWHESGILPRPGSRFNLDVEVIPKTLEAVPSSNLIKVQWSDGHESQYSSSWLRQLRFDESAPDTILDPTLRYWDVDVEKQLKKFDFSDIMSSDKVLLDWLVELKELGIAIIVGTPKKEAQLHEIGKRVFFLHSSHYGAIFKVQLRYNADGDSDHNPAYQTGTLPLHTDLPYYQRPPGIMMLHCLKQAGEGGESLVADGFKAAEDLKRENQEAYDLLTSTVFQSFDLGDATDYYGKYHQVSRHSVIQLNTLGQIHRIVLSDHQREAMLRVQVSKVLPTYRALKAFNDKLYDSTNLCKYKLREGDILCINNFRVLHGRASFKLTETTDRHLEGAYLEWDQVDSRIRVLQEENNK